jgi:SNARE protein 1
MELSKTEIKLKRLLATAHNQENQVKLIHYVATSRELLAQLTGENTREGLPSISTSKAKEYAEKIDALVARVGSDPLLEASERSKVSDSNQIEHVPKREGKQIADEVGFASASSTPVLRKRHIYNNNEQSKGQEGVTAKTESPIKLDAPSQRHIEKHRKLQEDLTDEMVGLARQLKESSLMMNQSLLDTEKILDSTERAVDHSLASTNNVNERAGQIYSQSFKTSCLSWLIIFVMSCMFLLVVLLIRIT